MRKSDQLQVTESLVLEHELVLLSFFHKNVTAVCKNLLQIGFIYLPYHEDKNGQQQEQCNDCQEDDPPGHFGKIYDLPLKEHRQFYLRMVASQGRGQQIRISCRDLVSLSVILIIRAL